MKEKHGFIISKVINPFTILIAASLFVFNLLAPLGCAHSSSTLLPSDSYISERVSKGNFPLSLDGNSVPIIISSEDFPGVKTVAGHLKRDLGLVTGVEPAMLTSISGELNAALIVGTIGKSPLIDQLIQDAKLDVQEIAGKWETFLIQVVEDPFPEIEQALVIAGSDKRGTIFGMYDFSAEIGVSPFYWWADVPVLQRKNLYVKPGKYSDGEPAVKYRGIFINDEAPALSGWVHENFGGFNHLFYAHVFELILRLKGNYLWPAMWGSAFYDDDPENAELADRYGIVIGTSHHEPLMRAHDEWRRYGSGDWNYQHNEDTLKQFWRRGIERMASKESIISIGMRGDGDEPMSEGTAIDLLEKIVRDQRTIIEEVTGKDISEIPQSWALYKEVQDYYDKGMRVPEDVTLLLCDDNWGNIRKLPDLDSINRNGGYGIYYHFDYVGGPRNYKWLNTNQIERTWEQMHLAYNYGADRIWIVNVGDIKPMELPMQFFLDYAWNPDQWPAERLPDFYRLWAEKQFGSAHAEAIGEILASYTKFNSRRKPELLAPDTYSLTHFREAERIVEEYNSLVSEAEKIGEALPAIYQDAYFQLVLFPVKACANLNELYISAGKNYLYEKQLRSSANDMASRVEELYKRDSLLTETYHTQLSDGKWNHMMSQTHIGYTYWQQPENNSMPEVKRIVVQNEAKMGVAIEGSQEWWPESGELAELPEFDPWQNQTHYIEVFNQGSLPFDFIAESSEDWILIQAQNGTIKMQERLWVSIDWEKVPRGENHASIKVKGPDGLEVKIDVIARNPTENEVAGVQGFVESNAYISMEAEHYSRAVESETVSWKCIPGLGRTLSSMTPYPVTAPAQEITHQSPRLEYDLYLFSEGNIKVRAYFSPSLNFHNDEGLQYGVSIDDEKPQLINLHTDDSDLTWETRVSNNINIQESEHTIKETGSHVLKFWMVDPGVVLQKLELVSGDGLKTYLGYPESHYVN